MRLLADYHSPLPEKPLLNALSIATTGASIGILVYFPFLKAAQTAKVTKIPYMQSLTALFHEATKSPMRAMYGRFPWSMMREAQWLTKYPLINWANQKLEPHVSNSHLRLFLSSALVATQEWICYGVGDFLYTTHENSKVNNLAWSPKEHLNRALKSRKIGAIPYIATNTTWQWLTMYWISLFQQSLFGRERKSVLLISTSIFCPTLLATIAMVPFNAVKTVAQISSRDRVLGTFEALSKLKFRELYRGVWPTIFLATAKITTGLTIATILSTKRGGQA